MLNNKLNAHGGLTPAASAPPQNAILAEQLTQYYPISEGELLGTGTVPSVSLPVLCFHIWVKGILQSQWRRISLEQQDKTLIHHYEEWIKVKEEDADWVIYHLLVQEPSISVKGLVTASGLAPCVVDASLERLERYLLIERPEGKLRVLNFGEALIRCQVKYSQDLPYTIENGVIKERKT